MLARLEDEREIRRRRIAQSCHRRHEVTRIKGRAAGERPGSGEEAGGDRRRGAQAAAGQAEPAVNAARKEVRAQEPIGGHAALGVADKPERLDVLLADLIDERGDDILKVGVVDIRPHVRRGVGRGDDQPVFVHVVEEREIVALPVAVRPGAVNAEDESDLLARLEVARIVEEVGAAGLHFDHGSLIDFAVRRAVRVGTVQDRRRGAGRARELDELLLGGGVSHEGRHQGDDHEQRPDQIARIFHAISSVILLDSSRNHRLFGRYSYPLLLLKGTGRQQQIPSATQSRTQWVKAGG